MRPIYSLLFCAIVPMACTQSQPSNVGTPDEAKMNAEFEKYWYSGTAEINSYKLQQARYGELRDGEAVLVFVTEDFSRSKQVKLDNPSKSPADAVSVLKMNMHKEFNTGIYKYSMMQSVFTPVERESNPHTLKSTCSIQDWCGQVFTQVNLQSYKYKISLRSYFESDGADQDYQIDKVLLEDEIWNLIRINPALLPEGRIYILPPAFASRLLHTPYRTDEADAEFVPEEETSDFRIYKLHYPSTQRSLEIKFSKAFPHTILGWTETYKEKDKELTTRATLINSIQSDYWNKNHNSDSSLRKELGLK